jgi:hypothetical protein
VFQSGRRRHRGARAGAADDVDGHPGFAQRAEDSTVTDAADPASTQYQAYRAPG